MTFDQLIAKANACEQALLDARHAHLAATYAVTAARKVFDDALHLYQQGGRVLSRDQLVREHNLAEHQRRKDIASGVIAPQAARPAYRSALDAERGYGIGGDPARARVKNGGRRAVFNNGRLQTAYPASMRGTRLPQE